MRKKLSKGHSKSLFAGTGTKTKVVNLANYHMRGGFHF